MSKEHSYAYEAGYRDGSINYELEHCPACKNVADLQEALAENDKLRELVKQMYPIAKAYLQFGVMLGRIDGMSYDWALQMIELGVEVSDD